MKNTIIKTKRFTLRPVQKKDSSSLAKNVNDKEIARNTISIPYPYTLKDAHCWINKNSRLRKSKEPKEINFVIDIKGEVAGAVGLTDIEGHEAQIGYWLGRNYWGQGLITEAVKAVTQFGFNKLKRVRIYAYVFPFNKASRRVLEKAGYQFEGILKKNTKKNGKFIDDYLFAKVK